MGGYGSSRWGWHSAKPLVEDCLKISAQDLKRMNLLKPNQAGSIKWKSGSKMGYQTYENGKGVLIFNLHYSIKRKEAASQQVDLAIALLKRPMPRGGHRYEMVCPLAHCRKRIVRTLFLPPGGRYFGCRHCYDLAYTSSRESRKAPTFIQLLSRMTGLSPLDACTWYLNSPEALKPFL